MSNPMSSTTKAADDHEEKPQDAEEALRNQLRDAMKQLKRREPLDEKYRKLLLGGIITNRRPELPKSHTYKRIGSNIRAQVELYMEQTQGKDPFDRILSRQPLQEEQMRAALTLREHKKHEQKPLLDATIAALPRRFGMDATTRRKHLESIALGLVQSKSVPKSSVHRLSTGSSTSNGAAIGSAGGVVGGSPNASLGRIGSSSSTGTNALLPSAAAELEQQKAMAKAREDARKKRAEDDEEKQRDDEIKRKKKAETPQQQLYKLYHPIFKRLWEMEFVNLENMNPFRIVIDKDSCTSLGAPDYFDVIDTPMNLTYIQKKVENMEYDTLRSFFNDVDLMINNALKYNSNLENPYRLAAEEMKRRYTKIARKVIQTYKNKQLQAQAAAAQQQEQQQTKRKS